MQSWQVSGELQSVGSWWVIWWWRRARERHWWKLNIWSQESESQGDGSRDEGNERISRKEVVGTENCVVGLYYFLLLFSNFIEIQFTYRKIHLLKVYSSMVFNIFTELCNHHQSNFRAFLSSTKEILYPFVSFLIHLPFSPPSPRPPLISFLSL